MPLKALFKKKIKNNHRDAGGSVSRPQY